MQRGHTLHDMHFPQTSHSYELKVLFKRSIFLYHVFQISDRCTGIQMKPNTGLSSILFHCLAP